MSEETNRHEFEEWVITKLAYSVAKYKHSEEYLSDAVGVAWESWQAARERQWLPIESAPKNTPILASDQFGVTSVVYWRDVSSSHLPRYAWSSHYVRKENKMQIKRQETLAFRPSAP